MSRDSCEHCGKPAVVHDVIIKGGERREVHLCAEHAKAAGYAVPSAAPIAALLGPGVAVPPSAPRSASSLPTACPGCGLSFNQFRQTGVLGCPQCYDAFGTPLASLIEKAQMGGLNHVGKTPRRGGGGIDMQLLRQRLARELEEAVAAEQYERAAKLRDRLLSLKPTEPRSGTV